MTRSLLIDRCCACYAGVGISTFIYDLVFEQQGVKRAWRNGVIWPQAWRERFNWDRNLKSMYNYIFKK